MPVVHNSPVRSPRGTAALTAILTLAGRGVETVADRAQGQVAVTHRNVSATLVPVWAGEGWPSDVARARASAGWAAAATCGIPVLVARRLSAQTRDSLTEQAVAWADEAGRAWLDLPGLLIVVRDPVPIGRDAREREFRWSPASGLIAEALLEPLTGQDRTGDRAPTATIPRIAEVSDLTGVSPPFISRTLRAFDAHGWTVKSGPARGISTVRTLTDPSAMLSDWATWYQGSRPDPVAAHGLIRDSDQWLGEVAAAWPVGSWAITGDHALERRAPFLTATPVVDLYLIQDSCQDAGRLADLLGKVGLRQVASGARVRLTPTSQSVLTLIAHGRDWSPAWPQVGDVRLYGDLLAGHGVRGAEAAEHLRTTRIGF